MAQIAAGIYCMIICSIVGALEYYCGRKRSGSSAWPAKSVGYFLVAIPTLIVWPTALLGAFYFMTSLSNFLAWKYNEEYDYNRRKPKKEEPEWEDLTCWERLKKTWRRKYMQGQLKKYIFASLWTIGNFILLIERWSYYSTTEQAKIDAGLGEPASNPFWMGMAKGFGTILDLNMAVILVPVCRTFIRLLYDVSTFNQSCWSRMLSFIFSFTPLDKALQWHKMMSGFVFVASWLHTLAHFINYSLHTEKYENTYGATVWITGISLLGIQQIIFCTAFDSIRFGKFELFWYCHHLFGFYLVGTLFHGKGSWNPHFWMYLIGPGVLYGIERLLRLYRSRQVYGVVSVTHMRSAKSSAYALEIEKTGSVSRFFEGQYAFIQCPAISGYQWHPFTIASAPQQRNVMFIIRNRGEGTWTGRLQDYLQMMRPKETHYKLQHRTATGFSPQALGPDGNPIIKIDGPYAAPTQHCGEYKSVVIVGAGIGVTPLRATLQSIIHYKFKKDSGKAYPQNAHFHWIVRHSDLPTFAFMCRTLKEAEDEWVDMESKNPAIMKDRDYQVHIWITRPPKKAPPFKVKKQDDDRGIFGPHHETISGAAEKGFMKLKKVQAKQCHFDEMTLYEAMHYARDDCNFGHIHLHRNRPKWATEFKKLKQRHPMESIGVMVCGPRLLADDLKKQCGEQSDISGGTSFYLHKENF